jgi:hypothetical protein
MDQPAAHLTPVLGVHATDDDDISRHAQGAMGSTNSSASFSTSGSTTRKPTSLRELASPRAWDPKRMTCASGAAAVRRRPRLGYRSLIDRLHDQFVTAPQLDSVTHKVVGGARRESPPDEKDATASAQCGHDRLARPHRLGSTLNAGRHRNPRPSSPPPARRSIRAVAPCSRRSSPSPRQ